ncbi:AI-2E family transporter [Roseiterribacter gracilis]|uniref:AI-2E family transporter n=1 Tax=Roseiterribacter gracilis TaxID=2812848 RepID=A0A8S8XBM2_9PROT|nr:AI-2E family transporter [Rhodospirillales bacterium TMPK1]
MQPSNQDDALTPPQRAARMALGIGLTLLALFVLRDFLHALGWSVILAIATWPLYHRFAARLGRSPSSAVPAGLFALFIALLVLVPLGFAAAAVVHEARVLVHLMHDAQQHGLPAPDFLARLPWGADMATRWWAMNLADPDSAKLLFGRVNPGMLARSELVGLTVMRRLVLFFVTLVALFFLFRDGVHLVDRLQVLGDRLLGRSARRLERVMVDAVRGTADGLVLVGLAEGAVLAVAYALLGVPYAVVLGAITGILATIPFGAPLVFCAAAFVLLVNGATAAAIALVVFGFIVVFLADHFARPALIGSTVRLPFLFVLLGIFGGVAAFGLLGLFLGPVILALFLALFREWTAT